MKINNVFGIKPSNTFISAGADYYVPNIKGEDKTALAMAAFEKSFKKTTDEIDEIKDALIDYSDNMCNFMITDCANIIHLYLALDNSKLNKEKKKSVEAGVKYFIEHALIFDSNLIPGIKLHTDDYILINSGIKVALPHNYSGIFLNKSGKGNAGYDVRAQVVDEDYTGFVHLSMSYNKKGDNKKNIIYCGDKLTQMLLIPVLAGEKIEEVDSKEYDDIMSGAQRGSDSFGSSDIKH